MRTIKLHIEYDGTEYCGWQVQPGHRTVQGELERALARITQRPVSLITAGRTDSGVHAAGQVAHFCTDSDLPCKTLYRGSNALLPSDIRVLAVEQVASDFHARFSARWRRYRYRLSTRPRAIGRQYVWTVGYDLDMDAMNWACTSLLGEQDFQSFCQSGADVNHYRCFVAQAEWLKQDDVLVFTIQANRFVHNMVRIVVGTLVDIGRGKRRVEEMQTILDARDRRAAGPTVPPTGLILDAVGYEPLENAPEWCT